MANTITINVLGDVSKFQSAMNGVQNDLGKVGAASTKAGNFMKSSFKVLGVGAAVAGVAVAKFATDSVTAASDLNETMSKTEAVFGPASKSILEWGKNSATALGMSTNEALTGASTFGNFFDQIGIGEKQSAAMSKQFVQMSADLGSFHNAAPVDVMDALAAATRGEYDALQKYIPTINAATVEQKAMEMTGKKTTDALTAQDKALALNALAMQDMGAAHGDFAKTSGSLANQQKILAANFENVKAKVGTALLPIMTELMGFLLKEGVPVLEKFADWFQTKGPAAIESATNAFKTFWTFVQPIFTFIGDNVGLILGLVGAFYAITAAIAAVNFVMAAYSALMTIIRTATIIWTNVQFALNLVMLANPFMLVAVALAALVAAIVIAWKNSETFRDIVIGAWEAIKSATSAVWEFLKNLTSTVWNAIKEAATEAAGAVKGAVTGAWDTIKTKTSEVWNGVKEFLSGLWDTIKNLVTTAFNGYKTIISGVWDTIKTLTTAAWGLIKEYIITPITEAATSLATKVGNIKEDVVQAWNDVKSKTSEIWEGIKTALGNAIAEIKTKIEGIKEKVTGAFSGAATWLTQAGKDIIQGLIGGITSMAKSAADAAINAVKGAIDAAKGLLKLGSPSKLFRQFGKWTVEGLAIGLGDGTNKVISASSELAKDVAKGFEAPQLSMAGGAHLNDTAYGGRVYQINVSVPPTVDKAAIGKEIVSTINEYERQGGRARAS